MSAARNYCNKGEMFESALCEESVSVYCVDISTSVRKRGRA
jgi:hypothetical protein